MVWFTELNIASKMVQNVIIWGFVDFGNELQNIAYLPTNFEMELTLLSEMSSPKSICVVIVNQYKGDDLMKTNLRKEQEKESIFITIPSIDVEVCLHNAGINLKVTESSVLAENFPITTETGVAKRLFKYSKETPDTEKLDEAVAFIKSLA